MRILDPALLFARAKGPLETVHVLHLSHASLSEILSLESLQNLKILYLEYNHLKRVHGLDGLVESLWALDLQHNKIASVNELANFHSFGYLNLSYNQLDFQAIFALRGLGIVELHLAGNTKLETQLDEYRSKVIALLPQIWTLDGKFITALERSAAMDRHKEFREQMEDIASQSPEWTNPIVSFSYRAIEDAFILQLRDKVNYMPEKDNVNDAVRASFINTYMMEFARLHNATRLSCPKPLVANGQLRAIVDWKMIQTLGPMLCLDFALLLCSFLEYNLPENVVAEAMIVQFAGILSRDIVRTALRLQPFQITSVIYVLRVNAFNLFYSERKEAIRAPSEEQIKYWESIPEVCTTFDDLLSKNSNHCLSDKMRIQRLSVTTILLSRAPSYVELMRDSSKNANLARLFECYNSTVLQDETIVDGVRCSITGGSLWVGGSRPITSFKNLKSSNPKKRHEKYRSPLHEPKLRPIEPSITNETITIEEATDLLPTGTEVRSRDPIIGDLVEVVPKKFVKILKLTPQTVTIARFTEIHDPPYHNSPIIPIRHLQRLSDKQWRHVHTPYTPEIRQQQSQTGNRFYGANPVVVDTFTKPTILSTCSASKTKELTSKPKQVPSTSSETNLNASKTPSLREQLQRTLGISDSTTSAMNVIRERKQNSPATLNPISKTPLVHSVVSNRKRFETISKVPQSPQVHRKKIFIITEHAILE